MKRKVSAFISILLVFTGVILVSTPDTTEKWEFAGKYLALPAILLSLTALLLDSSSRRG